MTSRLRALARPANLALLLILAAGAGLRFFRLDHSLRVDEAEAWMYAQWPLANYLLMKTVVVHLDFLTWMTTRVLGDAEFCLRAPHAVFGIAALFFTFLAGKKMFDEATGLLACCLLAFSVYHVRFSQEARYYAPLAAYTLAEFYFLLMVFDASSRRERWVYRGLLASSMFLSVIVHPFAFYPLILIVILSVFLGRVKSGFAITSPVVFCAVLLPAALILLFRPLLVLLWDFYSKEIAGSMTLRQSYLAWHYRPDGSILGDFAREFGGGGVAAWLFPVLCTTAICTRWRRHACEIFIMGLWIGLPLLSTAIVTSKVHFELRYFIFLLPIYLIWVAAGISGAAEIPSRFAGVHPIWKPLLVLVLMTVILHGNIRELSAYYAAPKSRMREAVRHIRDNCSPGDAVLPYPAWDIYWYRYYPLPAGCRVYPTNMLIPAEGEQAPLALMRGDRKIWLVATWIKDPARAEEFGRLRRLVERYYVLEEESLFRAGNENDDFHVYRYRKASSSFPSPLRAGSPRAPQGAASCLHLRSVTLMGNVEDSLQALPPGKTRVSWSLSPDIEASLFRPRPGMAVRSLRSARARLYFVWSGRVTWRSGNKTETYRRGDVAAVPAGTGGTWSSPSSDPGAVIEIPVSGERSPLAAGGGGDDAPSRFPNVWDSIERMRAGQPGEIILARKDGLVVTVRRTPRGAANTDMRHGGREASLFFSLILGGRVSAGWSGFDEQISFFPGDLYKTRLLPQPIPNEYGDGLHFMNPGDSELIELRVQTRNIPWTERLRLTSLEDEKLEAGRCLRGGIL